MSQTVQIFDDFTGVSADFYGLFKVDSAVVTALITF